MNCENSTSQKNETQQNNDLVEIKPKYAKLFTILKGKEYKILRVFDYATDGKLKQQQDFKIIEKAQKKQKNGIFVPIQSLAVCSHTHLACADLLGESEKITGLTESSFLAEEFWQQKITNKKVLEIGKNGKLNPEIIHKISPDIILTSNYDLSTADKDIANLAQAGMTFVPNLEWQENHPLGRAEWIKVFGLLFVKEDKSNEQFDLIEKKYLEMKNLAQKHTQNLTQKPTVMMGLPYQGTWYVAGGQSFMAQFLRDAGVQYHWDKNEKTASLPLNFEQIYDPLSKADFWINVGMATNKKSVFATDTRLDKMPNAKKIQIFNPKQNPKGGSIYLTKGVIEPHKVLMDFVKMFYPTLGEKYEFTYYTKLE